MSSIDRYRLVPEAPTAEDYVRLRLEAGLSAKTLEQARGAVAGSWAFAHVLDADDHTVAMGRVIGDGAWYFHLADMATLPPRQGRGLGGMVLDHLVERILASAPQAYVSLIADPPGRRLYESRHFRDVAPSLGMVLDPEQQHGGR